MQGVTQHQPLPEVVMPHFYPFFVSMKDFVLYRKLQLKLLLLDLCLCKLHQKILWAFVVAVYLVDPEPVMF